MNKIDFFNGLNEIKDISEIEIIYFSQNYENLFDDFKIDNNNLRNKSNSIINILSKFLPCSLPIIEEYLKKFYGYPNKSNSSLLLIYSDLLKEGQNNYKNILSKIQCNPEESRFLEAYNNNLSAYEKQEINFQGILNLGQKDHSLDKEIDKISSENRILENEEIGDLENISSALMKIIAFDKESKKIMESLRKDK